MFPVALQGLDASSLSGVLGRRVVSVDLSPLGEGWTSHVAALDVSFADGEEVALVAKVRRPPRTPDRLVRQELVPRVGVGRRGPRPGPVASTPGASVHRGPGGWPAGIGAWSSSNREGAVYGRLLPSELFTHLCALAAGEDLRARAYAVRERLDGVRPHQRFALLRQVRGLAAWQGVRDQHRSPSSAARVVDRALAAADTADQPSVLFLFLAHRSGFVRESAAHRLGAHPGVVVAAALILAADDPVPEVRSAASAHLGIVSLRDLAHEARFIASSAPDERRRAWREQLRGRLRSEEGRAALADVARDASGPEAEAAFRLLREDPEAPPLADHRSARSWRVRRAVAQAAADAGNVEVCAALLGDPRVAVRRAVAWQAAFLPGPVREDILSRALGDPSLRVLRVAAPYCRDLPATEQRLRDLLASSDPKARRTGLRLSLALGPERARPVLEQAVRSGDPSLRKAGYRGLFEAGLFDDTHVSLLAAEQDPTVLVAGIGHARRSGIPWPVLAPLTRGPVFEGAPGAAGVLAALPVWDAAPQLLRAVEAGWPGAENAVAGFFVRWQRQDARGWVKPSPGQFEAMRAALREHPAPGSTGARALVTAIRRWSDPHG